MVSWRTFETDAPELASFGGEWIDRRVSFLATIRSDGGPRVHPVTPWIAHGHLYVRMYSTSPKVTDLERDPRFALHSMMDNDEGVGGEFALNGMATRVLDLETVSAAFAVVIPLGSDKPLVLFELGVDLAVATSYPDDEPERRRWRAPHVS
jgi:hypothetical protein